MLSHIFDSWEEVATDKPTKFCASMWSKEESDSAFSMAREIVPGVKTLAIPQGLQVEKGPDAVVDFVKENWPKLVES